MGSKRDLKVAPSQLLCHTDKPAGTTLSLTFGINDNPVDVRMVLQKRLGLWGCQDRHRVGGEGAAQGAEQRGGQDNIPQKACLSDKQARVGRKGVQWIR